MDCLATDLIQTYIEENNALGNYMVDELISGRVLTEKTLITLLQGAIDSPESHHYGYILDGFPTFHSFDEQLRIIEGLRLKPDYVINIQVS